MFPGAIVRTAASVLLCAILTLDLEVETAKFERWHSNATVQLSVHLQLNVYPKHIQLYLYKI